MSEGEREREREIEIEIERLKADLALDGHIERTKIVKERENEREGEMKQTGADLVLDEQAQAGEAGKEGEEARQSRHLNPIHCLVVASRSAQSPCPSLVAKGSELLCSRGRVGGCTA